MTSTQLAEKIARLSWEKKGEDITILDVRELTDMTDYFILITAESDVHAKALSGHLEDELKKEEVGPWHKEGHKSLKWVILDFVDVVVHIFRRQIREFYSLEKLWGDARITRLEENVPDRNLLKTDN
ncbi:MAG: ribosome silencing factor [Calditrichia bacterium]